MNRSIPTKSIFTLVELLVVIAIISILAGMLLPALEKARESAQMASCMSNQRQFGLAMQMYANDHEAWLPTTDSNQTAALAPVWCTNIATYVGIEEEDTVELAGANTGATEIFRCPASDQNYLHPGPAPGYPGASYAVNVGNSYSLSKFYGAIGDGMTTKVTQYRNPSKFILMMDCWHDRNNTGRGSGGWSIVAYTVITANTTGYHNGLGGASFLFVGGNVEFMPVPSIENIGRDDTSEYGGYRYGY